MADPDLGRSGASQRRGGQPIGFQQGEVGSRIATGNRGLDRGATGAHLDGFVMLDNVLGRQNQVAAPDDAGSRPAAAGVDADDTSRGSFEDPGNVTGEVRQRRHALHRTPAAAIRPHPDGRDQASPFG